MGFWQRYQMFLWERLKGETDPFLSGWGRTVKEGAISSSLFANC
jgi:hypothetical protein